MENTLFTELTDNEAASLSGGSSYGIGNTKTKTQDSGKTVTGIGSLTATQNSSGGDTNNGGSVSGFGSLFGSF